MRRVLKLVLAALLIGACTAATPSALALACDQMFYYGRRVCYLSGEDEEWCYYECY
jgi:hypothetical protein